MREIKKTLFKLFMLCIVTFTVISLDAQASSKTYSVKVGNSKVIQMPTVSKKKLEIKLSQPSIASVKEKDSSSVIIKSKKVGTTKVTIKGSDFTQVFYIKVPSSFLKDNYGATNGGMVLKIKKITGNKLKFSLYNVQEPQKQNKLVNRTASIAANGKTAKYKFKCSRGYNHTFLFQVKNAKYTANQNDITVKNAAIKVTETSNCIHKFVCGDRNQKKISFTYNSYDKVVIPEMRLYE